MKKKINENIKKQREDSKNEVDNLFSNIEQEFQKKINEIDRKHFRPELTKLKDKIFPYILFAIFLFSLIFIPKILIVTKILPNFNNSKDIREFDDSYILTDFNNYKKFINKGIKHNFNKTDKTNNSLFF